MPTLASTARVALAAFAVLALACDGSSDEPSLAEAAQALCEASRGVDFSQGTWTNDEVRATLEEVVDGLRDVDVPDALRDYQSAQIEAIEALVELLRGADGDAVFVPSAGAFTVAYGPGAPRVSASLSEGAAAALEAAGCGLTP